MRFQENPPRNTNHSEDLSTERKVEILAKYLSTVDDRDILACFESNRPNAEIIGSGENANVYSVEDELLRHMCVKESKPMPKIKCNAADQEFDYQSELNKGGLKTPYTVAQVKDKSTQKEYIVMERIFGPSLQDIVERRRMLPEKFDFESFFIQLEADVKKMHELGVLHRDLHAGNVMMDEEGKPVIIDFGMASFSSPHAEDAYRGEVLQYNPRTERYEQTMNLFHDDLKQVINLKKELAPYLTSQSGKLA